MNDASRVLVVSSPSFDLTQKNFFAPLISGGRVYFPEDGPYDPRALVRQIHDCGITSINCTPSAFYPLVEYGQRKGMSLLSSLQHVVLGGESIDCSRLVPFMEHLDIHADIFNTYGPTECTDIAVFHRWRNGEPLIEKAMPTGREIPNVQLVVLDENLDPCNPGCLGELCIGGVGVGAGYVNRPDLTEKRFIPNRFEEMQSDRIYRTGDLVVQDSSGLIRYQGRLDHQVKIRGFRVELPEIEGALLALDGIREAAVLCKGDVANPMLVACLVPEEGRPVVSEKIKSRLSNRLPEYMVPVQMHAFESFPLSPNGKVDRKAILKRLDETPPTRSIPSSQLEEQILQVWKKVLDSQQIGVTDNFFDLGGNSIHLASAHGGLEDALGRTLDLMDLFTYATVRSLAHHLSEEEGKTSSIMGVGSRAQHRQAARNRRIQRNPL